MAQSTTTYPMLVETNLLKPVAKATVPARTKPFNAAEFFRNRPGLYVYDAFAVRLDFSARQTVNSAALGSGRSYVALLFKRSAFDRKVRQELPKNHLSTLEDIAGLIEAQPGGTPGLLLNNGYDNIFYVQGKEGVVLAVAVYWSSKHHKWGVFAWRLDKSNPWCSGTHVLCPGHAVL